MKIEVRDFVLDSYGHEGIVVREETWPGQAWQNAQADPRVVSLDRGERWIAVMPLKGGLIIAPASLCVSLRPANRKDVIGALETANEHGVKYLVELFPEIVSHILRR